MSLQGKLGILSLNGKLEFVIRGLWWNRCLLHHDEL